MSTYVSVLVLASMLAACTSLPPHDPMDAYRRYEQALNAGDVAATAAVWAADASFAGALGCPMPRPCISRAAIRSGFIEPAVAMKMQHQMVGEPEPDGADGATVRLQIGWPGMEKIAQGVTRIRGIDRFRVKDGQIVSKVFTPDLADAQTRAFYDAVKSAPPQR